MSNQENNVQTFYDDAFRVEQTRWKTWRSYNTEGKELITSLSEEQCIATTRWYLKGLQEGFPEAKAHEGVVGGKL
jgi:hypothetical protein